MGGTRIKIELDKKALFALASDTRLEILKALQNNRRTVSQLAEEVGVDKAAVHRHLKKLEEGNFVVRYEDHGFVYYGLSWKSRDLMSPGENTRIIVLLSSSVISILVVLVLILSILSSGFAGLLPSEQGSDFIDKDDPSEPVNVSTLTSSGYLLALLPLVAVALSCLAIGWRKMRKPLMRGNEDMEVRPSGTSRDLGD